MPIYEFKCEACAHIDELLMKMSDPAPEKCSRCGEKVYKIMSQSSFSLKGTGWYVTDYKNSGQQNKDPESNSVKSVTENKDSDAKSAPTSENNISATPKETPSTSTSTPVQATSDGK